MKIVRCVGAWILAIGPPSRTGLNPKSTIVTFAALLLGALFVFFHTARAEADIVLDGVSSDRVYSALVEFVEQTQPTSSNSSGAKESTDGAYTALRTFAQRIGAEQSEPFGARPKFAEADDAVGELRDLFRGGAEQPKSPSAGEKPNGAKKATPKLDGIGAISVGNKVCMTCHATLADTFGQTLMGRIDKSKNSLRYAPQCETCHGPGSAHVKAGGGRGVGGIISFRPDDASRTVEENNVICLGCHEKGNQTYWRGSTHQIRDVACVSCHTVMRKVTPRMQLKQVTVMDTCFQCHKDRRAETMRSSHMPVREGKITCANCHNPHGSATEKMLKGNSVNDTCYRCHADKRGPFLFEHAPVRENCLNCHEAHGSNHEYLLKVMRPRLCQQCHTAAMGYPGASGSILSVGNSCQNCHTQVHGSNHPSGGRGHR